MGRAARRRGVRADQPIRRRTDPAGLRLDLVLQDHRVPTGVGCLLMRRDRLDRSEPTVVRRRHDHDRIGAGRRSLPPADEAAFEDGTVDYLNIPAVGFGLEHIEGTGRDSIHRRVTCLTRWLLDAIDRAASCATVGRVVEIHRTDRHAPTVAARWRSSCATVTARRSTTVGSRSWPTGPTSRCAPDASATPAPARSRTISAPRRWRSGSVATNRCRPADLRERAVAEHGRLVFGHQDLGRRGDQLRRRLPVHVLPAGLRRPNRRRHRTCR